MLVLRSEKIRASNSRRCASAKAWRNSTTSGAPAVTPDSNCPASSTAASTSVSSIDSR